MSSGSFDNRGTLFPSYRGANLNATESKTSQAGQQASSIKEKLIPIKDIEQQTPSAERSKTSKRTHPNAILQRSPWTDYRPFIEEQQAGPVVVAHSNDINFDLVAIKERKSVSPNIISGLSTALHSNIVFLQKIYEHEETIFFVYEYLDLSHISLSDLRNTPGDNLNEAELAAVCNQALKGLSFIHEKLKIAHGSISADNMLIAQNGMIKIANVADAMIDCRKDKMCDARSLGDVLRYLMKSSSIWGKPILDFLEATNTANIPEHWTVCYSTAIEAG